MPAGRHVSWASVAAAGFCLFVLTSTGLLSAAAPVASLTGPDITGKLLETSSLSFYGFYGFYGVKLPEAECPLVRFQYALYNYGSQDLAQMSTIHYILDKSKIAITSVVLDAVPTIDPSTFTITLSELNGEAVTYIIVTAEVDFGHNYRAGGAFLRYLGVTPGDLASDLYVAAPPSPRSGSYTLGLQAVVRGYNKNELDSDDNLLAAFQATFEGSIINSIKEVSGSYTAEGATVGIFGFAEAYSNGVAVAFNIFFSDERGGRRFYAALSADPYAVYAEFGALAGHMKITEAVQGRGDPDNSEVADNSGDSSGSHRRSLLQYTGRDSGLARHLAAKGLGVAAITAAECPSFQRFSSFYGLYGAHVEIQPALGHAGHVSTEMGNSALGSSSLYGFYGSSSFYGIYGAEASDASGVSDSRGSFYGFAPAHRLPSSPTPHPNAPPSTPQPTATYPVFFTAILSDYSMEDLANPEDVEALKALYIKAVESAVQLVGITSNPTVSVLAVKPGSIAIDTVVVFINDLPGAQLFEQILNSNPAILFPAFSSIGTVYITNIHTDESAQQESNPSRIDGSNSINKTTTAKICNNIDRFGECCYAPAALDAKRDCCWEGVDECGVCGGSGNTCATAATVRVSSPFKPGLDDKTSTAFNQLLVDFRVAVSQLFESYAIDPLHHLDVDATMIEIRNINGQDIELDTPFKIFPDISRGITAPNLLRTKAILQAAAEQRAHYKDLTLLALLDVRRVGVCGNGFCEFRELQMSSMPGTCSIDCPGIYSCPVGDALSLVGDRSLQCVGKGICVQATGTCKCEDGYASENCGACASGYVAANGICYAAPGLDDSLVPVKVLNDGGTSSSKTSSPLTRDIVIGVVFGLVGLILISVAIYWMVALRNRQAENQEPGNTSFISTSAMSAKPSSLPPSSHHDPPLPTRQSTENVV